MKLAVAVLSAFILLTSMLLVGVASYAFVKCINRRWPKPAPPRAYTPQTLDEVLRLNARSSVDNHPGNI
ncbi:hypothetical protein ASPBRDRAFT_36929, partial [Aspergillus brasiliensis CBS 101740]